MDCGYIVDFMGPPDGPGTGMTKWLRSSLLTTHLGKRRLLALHTNISHANFFDASFLWCHSKSNGQGVGRWLRGEMSFGGDESTAE